MADLAMFKCPNCGSPLRADDWDRSAGLITCSFCKTIISTSAARQKAEPTEFRERAEVPLPPRLTCRETPMGTEISYRWFTPAVLFLLFFCIAWDSFLVFWYSIAFTQGAPWIMVIFPIAHVAIGVGLSYFVAASIVNNTVIRVDGRTLSITHGPLPWRGSVSIPAETLDQLYCKARVSSSRNGTSTSYEVWTTLLNGTSRKLVSTGLDADQALFIEQKIERALGIKDRAVPGEMGR